MSRRIIDCNTELTVIAPFETVDFQKWIEEQCKNEGYSWVLVHLLGGVVWGRYQSGILQMKENAPAESSDGFADTDKLSIENLLQLRLFSKNQELFCWRDLSSKLKGRVIRDHAPTSSARWRSCIEEDHVLWGTEFEKQADEFVILTERGRELQQTIPLVSPPIGKQRLNLKVRQYLETCPSSGQLIVRCGRLVEIVGG